jgi:hypothetical protein
MPALFPDGRVSRLSANKKTSWREWSCSSNTPAQEVFYGLKYRAGGHAVQA